MVVVYSLFCYFHEEWNKYAMLSLFGGVIERGIYLAHRVADFWAFQKKKQFGSQSIALELL